MDVVGKKYFNKLKYKINITLTIKINIKYN